MLKALLRKHFKFLLWEHTGCFMGAYGGLTEAFGDICHNR